MTDHDIVWYSIHLNFHPASLLSRAIKPSFDNRHALVQLNKANVFILKSRYRSTPREGTLAAHYRFTMLISVFVSILRSLIIIYAIRYRPSRQTFPPSQCTSQTTRHSRRSIQLLILDICQMDPDPIPRHLFFLTLRRHTPTHRDPIFLNKPKPRKEV